jgi:perosamine synthetase
MIPYSKPDITWREKLAVLRVMNTPMLSTGPKIVEFENSIKELTDAKLAKAVNSGTSALHLILEQHSIGQGDEVITTPFTFVATANAIEHCGAKTVFSDIDPQNYMLDCDLAKQKVTNSTQAFIPVHLFGKGMSVDELVDTNLLVFEDAAEALGVYIYHNHNKVHAGMAGNAGFFGFFPNKQITTGEGGMIVSRRDHYGYDYEYNRAHGLNLSGRVYCAGHNYKLTAMQATVGVEQLKRFEELKQKRIKAARKYNKYLQGVNLITKYFSTITNFDNPFIYHITLNKCFTKEKRDSIIKYLSYEGIPCKTYFDCVHLQPYYMKKYGYKEGDFPIAESISDRSIALPFYPTMPVRHIRKVVKHLKGALLYVS